MNKFILMLVMVISISSYPLVSEASWWNPLSWNKSSENKTIKIDDALSEKIKELENRITEMGAKTSSSTPLSVNIPDIDKDKSNLDNKIVSLTKENNQLKVQIKTLTDKILVCEAAAKSEIKDKNTEPAYTSTLNSEKAIVQQLLPSKDDRGYGYYQAKIKVTAGSRDIYIPKTTTDSATNDLSGINYSTVGGDSVDFKGTRSSIVTCSTIKSIPAGTVCFVKAGTSLDIDVNVYLRPKESGTYSVKFENIRYYFETSTKKYGISPDKIEIEGDTQSDSLYIL